MNFPDETLIQEGVIPIPKPFNQYFDGYLGEKEDGVFISFINAREEFKGKGYFSKLLRYLKGKYNWIRVPTPSDQMVLICVNKGFVLKKEWFPEPFNELGDILLWEKKRGDLNGKPK